MKCNVAALTKRPVIAGVFVPTGVGPKTFQSYPRYPQVFTAIHKEKKKQKKKGTADDGVLFFSTTNNGV